MSADFQLSLSFKGARNYLHGTDMHDAVCDLLADQGFRGLQRIDFTLHRLVLTQIVASIYREETPEEGANAVFRAESEAGAVTVALKESGAEVTGRRPYDEDSLVSTSTYDSQSRAISVAGPPSYSNIEIIVALNKALLLRTLPEANGKWLFTRLQLSRSIRNEPVKQFEIRFQGHSNYRITRSQVFGDGQPLGSIFFSLQPAE